MRIIYQRFYLGDTYSSPILEASTTCKKHHTEIEELPSNLDVMHHSVTVWIHLP